jgi:mutual gliding-motility protein MglA
MALIEEATQQIHCKIVYYGLLFGVQANTDYIYHALPPADKSKQATVATETPRFDFFEIVAPPEFDTIPGYSLRLHLYAAHCPIVYEQTKVAVLKKADGAVFVADSQSHKIGENLQLLYDLGRNIQCQGRNFQEFPLVLQYNNRNLPDALPLEVLDYYLNSDLKVPHFSADASSGEGVFDTLKAITKMVVSKIQSDPH